MLRAKHFDRLTPEERTKALKKWGEAGKVGRVTPKCAEHSDAKAEKRATSGPAAVFAMMSASSRPVEQGDLAVHETALDSDYCETKASGMAGPPKG